jgi:hypothetical protein
MLTEYYRTRFVICFVILALMLSSCNASGADATRAAVYSQAKSAMECELAAVTLVGAQTLQQAAPNLWAISKAVTNQPGAWMYLNDCQKIAVFIAEGGKTASGASFYFSGFVNVERAAIIDANSTLISLGIDPAKITTLEDMTTALRARGFVELTAVGAPMLVSSLRLALGFLKSIGGTLTDIMIVPTYVLTPDQLYPWVSPDWTPAVQ